MVLKQRLDQRQVQKLILAPALQQAIKLLPLDQPGAHRDHRHRALAEPPPRGRNGGETVPESRGERRAAERTSRARRVPSGGCGGDAETAGGPAEAEDLEFESHFQDYLDDGFRPYFSDRRDVPALENTLSKSPSLLDLLNVQANVTFFR